MTVVNLDGPRLLEVAVAAHLARYQGESRTHTESDLRIFLGWCSGQQLDPLTVRRVDIELFLRWLQETCRFKPSTVSRRLSVVTCFYRTCVIDTVLDTSPAAYVRRPAVPPESPTLGLSHLQFEAMIVAARMSSNPTDIALVAMLGLLGLRIFEACQANITDLTDEHGHRVLRVYGKGNKTALEGITMRITSQQRQQTEQRIRAAMDRLLRGDIPAGGSCDIKTLAAQANVDRTAFYGNRPYAHLREEFETRLQAIQAAGDSPDPRTAQISRLKKEIEHLRQRLSAHDQTIAELTDFKTLALSQIAAQHDEITRLTDVGNRQQQRPPPTHPPRRGHRPMQLNRQA